ncbi:7TM diverse intracellular signaling domain-containing protein [Paenibacillus xerothermodurans]|uniref:7TM diverse intracellular signaling domain-containing protein n=1 Tax=Paenibacillus xerothermodurans TaxID=1977292 RepID=UPI001401CAB0|nr:7TM diverse intracellular signaling domain-containing protein [Paenibacillus xerothermodurans]
MAGSGYATFQLQVLLDPGAKVMALELPTIRSAYVLWINGQPMGGAGRVAASVAAAEPGCEPKVVFFEQGDSTTVDIVLQVSNYDHRLGGIWQELILGDAQLLSDHHNQHLAVEMLLVGSLLLMGFYHLGLCLIRRQERGALYFGVLCLLVGMRSIFVGEGGIYEFFPRFPWETGLRIEYVCFFLAVPIGLMFLRSLYSDEIGPRVTAVAKWLGCLFSIAVLLLPARIFSWTTQTYQIITAIVCLYAVVRLLAAIRRQREGSGFAFAGVIVYLCTVGIDIAFYNQWILTGDVSTIGLFYFIFMTSFIISLKSFKAFAAVESLSRQLVELNTGLEQRIQARTAELKRSNRNLEQMDDDLARLEKSRRHLLSNISHDLGTPMTLIQGYIEALVDEVIVEPDQQRKYLRMTLSRINGLNRLISDLFQLSKLEAR